MSSERETEMPFLSLSQARLPPSYPTFSFKIPLWGWVLYRSAFRSTKLEKTRFPVTEWNDSVGLTFEVRRWEVCDCAKLLLEIQIKSAISRHKPNLISLVVYVYY